MVDRDSVSSPAPPSMVRVALDVHGQRTCYERGLQGSDLFTEMDVVDEDTLAEFPGEAGKVENRDAATLENLVCYDIVLRLISGITMEFHVGLIVD